VSKSFGGVELWNTAFAPTWKAHVSRDDESAASFIAHAAHLLTPTRATYPGPAGYAYSALSDLSEEIDTRTARAYVEGGSYGLLLKGDPAIPESFDVPKPAFNAFRALHMMGNGWVDSYLSSADGVHGIRADSEKDLHPRILIYNHGAGGTADSSSSTLVAATVILAFSKSYDVRHYMIDRAHSNSYRTWINQGKPATPTRAQWIELRDTGELCYYRTTVTTSATGSWTVQYPQPASGVSLFVITPL